MASHLQTARRALPIAGLLAGLLLPVLAHADTVYLKNGRSLQAQRVEVVGDRVVLQQNGNRVELPMSIVDRIERDAERSAVLGSRVPPTTPPVPPAGEATGEAAEEAGGEESAEGQEGEQAETPPEQTREYWQEAVKAIQEEKAQIEGGMQELRREERAFLFSHRSTTEVKAKIAQAEQRLRELDEQLTELRSEARRKGIPPGWLRISA